MYCKTDCVFCPKLVVYFDQNGLCILPKTGCIFWPKWVVYFAQNYNIMAKLRSILDDSTR